MNEERYRRFEERLWDSVAVRPTERRLRLERIGVTVRVQEVGEGPTILFVHGASNGGASWAGLAAQLPGFHCVLLDRPGCGLSEPLAGGAGSADLEAVKQVADLMIPDVLDAMSANVVATSFGGFFAFRAAANAPERIERILEFSWPMGAPMVNVPLVMRLAGIPGMNRLTAKMPVSRSAARMILKQVGLKGALESGRFTDEMLDWFVSLLKDTNSMENEIRSTPRVITPLAGLNEGMIFPRSLLERVVMPVHLFWGGQDPNGGSGVARQFAAQLPNATLEVLPEAGHAPWIDEPDRAAAATAEFFAK